MSFAACDPSKGGDDSAIPIDLVTSLAEPGPYNVGYQEGSVTYHDPALASDGDQRTLRFAVWYPTDDTSGTDATYDGFYPAPGVWDGASYADGPFPLAVFSHGHQGYAEYSSFLMAHLASHGWIVAAPDHTGNTTFDSPDRTTEIYLQRPLDISLLIGALTLQDCGGCTASSGLSGLPPIDGYAPVLGLGHSFGGYTMLALAGATYDMDTWSAACAAGDTSNFCSTMTPAYETMFRAGFADDRIGAYVIMAAGDTDLFGADGLAAIEKPILHMTASEDQGSGSEGDFLWDNVHDGDDLRVILEGAGHQSFTDYADTMEDVPMEREDGWRIIDVYGLAWAEHLGGDDSVAAVLDGSEPVSDDATLER